MPKERDKRITSINIDIGLHDDENYILDNNEKRNEIEKDIDVFLNQLTKKYNVNHCVNYQSFNMGEF